MKRMIEDILIKCGCEVREKGFSYITEAIIFMIQNPNVKLSSVYESVSKDKFSTSPSIEHGMRNSMKRMLEKGDSILVSHYFGKTNKLSNCLYNFAWRIKRELEDNACEANS